MCDFPELTVNLNSQWLAEAACEASEALERAPSDHSSRAGHLESVLRALIWRAERSSAALAEAYEALQEEVEERERLESLDPRVC